MIKYNNSNINDWNFDDSNIVKVYHNGAVCYYKIITSGGTSGQTPCFAVVDDISQYSDTEFEDVFNQADEKWYKLNNLNQYEEYGIYGSGRTITTYEGKLTIDDGYEYQYSGNTWVNVGEISGSTNAYRYWMWRSVGEIVGDPSNFIQFSEFDLVVNGSDVSLSCVSAAPFGVTNETADKLFDNDTSTKYCADFSSYLNTNYILFDAQSAIAPTAFAMTTANDNSQYGRYPTSWVLLGSNTSTTNWNDGSWNLVLSGTCGNEMRANYTRFEYPIIYDYSQLYLTLQALESGTIGFSNGTVDYSTDSGSTWNTLAQGNTISVSQGDEVLFKKSVTVPDTYTGIGTFTSSCRFNVYGNIMSMQEGDNFATATTIANYEFYFKRLFAGSKVVSAENMVLPATTLQNFCYNEIFKDATYLTTPPKIFPATGLTQDCYSYAFNGCTSLTKSPVICGETAARGSFAYMFTNCTSLSEVSCLATDVSAEYATYDWLNNVASSGTFYKNPNASWSRGTSGIPSNWNVEDYVEPTPSVYPVYYDEIQDPPNNLSFSSMTEAEEYECPWVGMKATIDGSGYTFSGDSQSGYEWVHNPSRLPFGYTEVQYIENTDYASLAINYHPNQDTRIVTTMQAVQTNENPYGRFIGSGHWDSVDGKHGYQFDYEEYPTGQLHISWGAKSGWDTNNSVYGDYSAHTYDWNKNEFNIDNTLVASTTYQNFTCENKLGIFAEIYDNDRAPNTYPDESKEYLRGKLYDFKIYDDGALVADLVPCTNPNNIAGVYDIVNDVFYTAVNQGYYFVAGPTV